MHAYLLVIAAVSGNGVCISLKPRELISVPEGRRVEGFIAIEPVTRQFNNVSRRGHSIVVEIITYSDGVPKMAFVRVCNDMSIELCKVYCYPRYPQNRPTESPTVHKVHVPPPPGKC